METQRPRVETYPEFDPKTVSYYYRARYYDPNIGRFLSEDGIGNDEGFNVYLYVGNAPSICETPPDSTNLRALTTQTRRTK